MNEIISLPRCWWSNVEFAILRNGVKSPEYRDALAHPGTCLLPSGHEGPHEWTFDGDVTFTFAPKGGKEGGWG